MQTDPRQEMIDAATDFYRRGWMVGTSGNLSARIDRNSFWITVSGRDKGALAIEDFIRVSTEGEVLERFHENDRPSAETCIHQEIYTLFPEAGACFHVHTVPANLVSTLHSEPSIPLPPLEMIKGLGVWEETPLVSLPVISNHLDVPRVAQKIRERFSAEKPQIPALLVHLHGTTTWGSTTRQTKNHVEILEFILHYMVEAQKLSLQK